MKKGHRREDEGRKKGDRRGMPSAQPTTIVEGLSTEEAKKGDHIEGTWNRSVTRLL